MSVPPAKRTSCQEVRSLMAGHRSLTCMTFDLQVGNKEEEENKDQGGGASADGGTPAALKRGG